MLQLTLVGSSLLASSFRFRTPLAAELIEASFSSISRGLQCLTLVNRKN